MRIASAAAKAIPDTRGRPTVETTLAGDGFRATASAPSGKSTGKHEALELRDANGGVAAAIGNVNGEIAAALAARDFGSADEVDAFLVELDGTPDKSRLGANAILSVSIAAARLFALFAGVPLWKAVAERAGTTPSAPHLFVNMMNGGAHADFKLPFQEYLLIVKGKTSISLPAARAAFAKLGERLGNVPMGDEGGYAPTFDSLEKPFELLAGLAGEFPHADIAIDAAANGLFHDGKYELLGKAYSSDELSTLYADLAARFPLRSIEDPFEENAHDDFARLTAALGSTVHIIGDDFTVTDPARVQDAASRKEINAVLIKPNQIGTVREAIQAVQATYAAGWKAIASHRSGETNDSFIADFAYGIGAHGIKAGGFGQNERMAKYERLLAIEREAEVKL